MDTPRDSKTYRFAAGTLMWTLPLLLVVPGAILAYTEYLYSGYDRFVNIALPLRV